MHKLLKQFRVLVGSSFCLSALLLIVTVVFLLGQSISVPNRVAPYVLGAGDLIAVRVLDLEEYSAQNLPPVRIDNSGDVRLPLVDRIHASGLSIKQLESEIGSRLSTIMKEPEVSVVVTEFRSHPVSVLGAVKNPGVHEITGRKTLFEVLSLAGGLSADAGNIIKITRRVDAGSLPLSNATREASGEFQVGELNIRAIMEARNPSENIDVLSNDVITVPKADLVYVVGAVKRSGGFVLSDKEQLSALQALSLAEGLDRAAAPKHAKILRQGAPGSERTEVPLNLERVLDGRANDIVLHANDILFVPKSAAKNAGIRALETAIQLGTGVVIYRR